MPGKSNRSVGEAWEMCLDAYGCTGRGVRAKGLEMSQKTAEIYRYILERSN